MDEVFPIFKLGVKFHFKCAIKMREHVTIQPTSSYHGWPQLTCYRGGCVTSTTRGIGLSHTSHALQPLDIVWFKPIKLAFRACRDIWSLARVKTLVTLCWFRMGNIRNEIIHNYGTIITRLKNSSGIKQTQFSKKSNDSTTLHGVFGLWVLAQTCNVVSKSGYIN